MSSIETGIRKLACLMAFAGLTACGGGGGDGVVAPTPGTSACGNDGQKQFVLDALYDWYLWNDILPSNISIADYDSPEDLIFRVTTELGPKDDDGNTLDWFSSVGSAEADSQFFGEGKFEGFGFSWRFADQAQTDFRVTRTFQGSPADLGGLARGQQVLSLNGRSIANIVANEGVSQFFDDNDSVNFLVQPLVGASFSTGAILKDIVTIPPIPQWRIIDASGGRKVGYMELSTFISTAEPIFDEVFAAFKAQAVNEVIIDLRYNGGGLVRTAELLGDYLGGAVAGNLIFSQTQYNSDRAAQYNETSFFDLLGNSINLSRLVIVATGGTASASELVTNGMIPHVDVAIVGDRTFGKPVGQIGLEFCDKIMRPTAFKTANADNDGDYFGGLPVDCTAPDDLNYLVGEDQDPNMLAAMTYLETGSCPVSALAGSQSKAAIDADAPEAPERQPLHRQITGAY